MRRRILLAACVVLITSILRAGPTATFQGLGTDGHAFSSATAVSADGSTVVGNSFDEIGSQAFRWTRAGGMQSLGGINGDLSTRSFALSVNADGSVVVGRAEQPDNVQAFRWTGASGMVGLGEKTSELNAVSADGTIGAGRFHETTAATWSQANGWSAIPGADDPSNALGISADGSVIVGVNQNYAFRWSPVDGPLDIGPTGDIPVHSVARDVSDDGSVVVGDTETAQAFRFVMGSGVRFINPDDTQDSFAYATDADGSTIVGQVGFQRAYIWDEANGLRDLQNLLLEKFGVGNLAGWTLERAFGISGDGKTIVGDGKNPSGNTEAWIATLGDESRPSPIPLPAAILPGSALLLMLVGGGRGVRWGRWVG
jgi:probable HAF family extracellular repeat protein